MNMMCRETILKKVLADEQVKTFFHILNCTDDKKSILFNLMVWVIE